VKPYTYSKQPAETRKLEFDASKSLVTGDSILSVAAAMWDGDTDVSATMISGSSTISGTKIYTTITGGTDGTTYWLRLRITTTLGEIIEDDLKIIINQIGK
jgi:hypothetical protein